MNVGINFQEICIITNFRSEIFREINSIKLVSDS